MKIPAGLQRRVFEVRIFENERVLICISFLTGKVMETDFTVASQRCGLLDIGFARNTDRTYKMLECGTEYRLEHRVTKTRIHLLLVVVSRIFVLIFNFLAL
jgi:hypothetical protein